MSDWVKYDCLGEEEHIISPLFFEKHKEQLTVLYNGITEKLKKYPNFRGVRFLCSDKANEVVVDLLHHGAYRDYAVRYFMHSDFVGTDNILHQCEHDWFVKDNSEAIQKYYDDETAKLISSCEKYGYD